MSDKHAPASQAFETGQIDAELARFMRRIASIDASVPEDPSDPLGRRRRIGELVADALPPGPQLDVQRRDVEFRPPAGHIVPVRLYLPPATGPRKLMPYFHGGGWVVGDIASHDKLCARIAHETGYAVASVHYRRAPEHPYPAPLQDCCQTIAWLLQHAELWEGEGDAPIALGGDSSGAHLAVACAMRALLAQGPAIDRMLLFYPPVLRDADTASMRQFGHGGGLTQAAMSAFWQAYTGDPDDHADDPCVHLPLWPRPAELPPAVLVTAECDILRDEGEDYARQLWQGGAKVVMIRAPGMAHGFARMLTASRAAAGYVVQACGALQNIA